MFASKDQQVPQNWDALEAYLKRRGHTLDREFTPRQFGMGSANLNYQISMDGSLAVFRRPPDGPLPPGANDIGREYKVLSRLNPHYAPAPNGLLYCDDASVIGVPFCISEFREGTAIGRELPHPLQKRAQVGNELSRLVVTALAELHRVDPEMAGLGDLGNADGFIGRQIKGWHKRGLLVLDQGQQEKLGQMRDWLNGNMPPQCSPKMVHNDFKLDNMLVDLETLTLNAVVDWDMCTIGDPLFELAILLSYWGHPNDNKLYRCMCRMPCDAQGWWDRRQVVAAYSEITGVAVDEQQLKFYWLLALYRNAVVYAQLKRMFAGTKPSNWNQQEFLQLQSMTSQCLDHAVSLLERPMDW